MAEVSALLADAARCGADPGRGPRGGRARRHPPAWRRREQRRCAGRDTARKGAQWTSQALTEGGRPPPRRSWWPAASASARPRSWAPSRDQPAAHRGRDDLGQRRIDDLTPRRGQDDHDGRHGLRPHHARPGPDPVPVRHAGPGPVLVHVGRPASRGAIGAVVLVRHPPPGRLLPAPSTTSRTAVCRSSSRSTASTACSPTPRTRCARHCRSVRTPRSSRPTPGTARRREVAL